MNNREPAWPGEGGAAFCFGQGDRHGAHAVKTPRLVAEAPRTYGGMACEEAREHGLRNGGVIFTGVAKKAGETARRWTEVARRE